MIIVLDLKLDQTVVIHVRLLNMKCIFSSYKLWTIFFNILVLYWWLNNLFIYLCLFFLPALWICITKLFSLIFFHFVFVYVICVFLYTIVNWIMRIKIYIIICVYTLTKINHNIEKNALNNTTRCIIIHIIILSYTSQMNKINKLVLEIRRIFCFGTRIFTWVRGKENKPPNV